MLVSIVVSSGCRAHLHKMHTHADPNPHTVLNQTIHDKSRAEILAGLQLPLPGTQKQSGWKGRISSSSLLHTENLIAYQQSLPIFQEYLSCLPPRRRPRMMLLFRHSGAIRGHLGSERPTYLPLRLIEHSCTRTRSKISSQVTKRCCDQTEGQRPELRARHTKMNWSGTEQN